MQRHHAQSMFSHFDANLLPRTEHCEQTHNLLMALIHSIDVIADATTTPEENEDGHKNKNVTS